MTLLFYQVYVVLHKIYVEGAFLKQALSSPEILPNDRAKVTKIVYGVLDRDIELDYYISRLSEKSPKKVVKIILKIAFYNIKYLNKTPYSVTDASVSLLKKMGKGGMSGFLNAVLRKFSTSDIPLPQDKTEYLSIKYSYPLFAVKKLLKKYSLDELESILAFTDDKTCLRFKKGIDGESYLKNLGVNYTLTPYKNVFFVKNFKLEQGFFVGDYTVQSIGSVAICQACGQGETLLDCCSAPGGKAVNLSEQFSFVTACELHSHRVELINSYAKRMGVKNITILEQDATQLNQEFLDKFDVVLCDAPCSGFGVVGDNPDIKLNRSIDSVNELKDLQLSILKNCSQYVKKGGYLIYSTCSILPEENEQNVERFLKENGGFKHVPLNLNLECKKENYGVTFLPNISLGAGFYCCKLKRL